MHQQRLGTAPAEGHASVVDESSARLSLSVSPDTAEGGDRSVQGNRLGVRAGGGKGSSVTRVTGAAAKASASAAAAAAAAATAGGNLHAGAVPGIHQMYHLDAASLEGFGQAAAAATRALGALLTRVSGNHSRGGSAGGDSGSDHMRETWPEALPAQPGVASLLLGAKGGGGGAVVETIADVRDTFRELVVAAAALGVVVPCAPEGAGEIFELYV